MRYIVLPVGWLALAALGAEVLAAQERPGELTGCYDITAPDLLTDDKVGSGLEHEIPRRIEFAGPARGWDASDTLRTEIVVPEGALPSVHHLMSGEIVGDSLNVGFSTGYGGVTAVLGWQIRLHYADPGAYSNVETRLRRAYGVPGENELGYARFSNPTTSLVLIDLAGGAGDVLLSFR